MSLADELLADLEDENEADDLDELIKEEQSVANENGDEPLSEEPEEPMEIDIKVTRNPHFFLINSNFKIKFKGFINSRTV